MTTRLAYSPYRNRSMIQSTLHKMRGVTLLELMIVVVVVAVLASVALPNYRAYAARAKRAEARAALLQIATNQERHYLQNNTYTTDMTELGFPEDPFTTASGAYIVDVNNADANNYDAAALYQKTDEELGRCGTFTIDGSGVKGSLPYDDCWTRSN